MLLQSSIYLLLPVSIIIVTGKTAYTCNQEAKYSNDNKYGRIVTKELKSKATTTDDPDKNSAFLKEPPIIY